MSPLTVTMLSAVQITQVTATHFSCFMLFLAFRGQNGRNKTLIHSIYLDTICCVRSCGLGPR